MKKHAVDYLEMDNWVSNRITRQLIIIEPRKCRSLPKL